MKSRILILTSAIFMGVAAMVIFIKAYLNRSSTATGLTFLALGLLFLIIGTTRNVSNKKESS